MKKNKAKKKHRSSKKVTPAVDPIVELRSIIESEIARREGKKPLVSQNPPAPPVVAAQPEKPKEMPVLEEKTPPPAPEPAPKAPEIKQEIRTEKAPLKAAKAEEAQPLVTPPDFSVLTGKIMQIAARSQKIVNAFLDRNRTLIAKIPSADPAHLGQAFSDFTGKVLSNPEKFVDTQIAFWQDYIKLMQTAMAASSGGKMDTVIQAPAGDRRFKDPAWEEVWVFDFIKQSYLLMARWAQSLVDHIEGLDPKVKHKLVFYTSQMIDALSPSNFWMTNPEVLRTTLQTRGENLINGLENLLGDIERGGGQLLIRMSDNTAFHFGENIATSKGKVVYQNELMQLIQFSPLTEKVHKTPLLIVPPWINKYYILDLKPENSFIRYLTEQGHTVYCISWVNPDSRHAKMSFEDYMALGPVAAATEVKKITGEDTLNCIGYCIGGTLLACTLGWLTGLGENNYPAEMPKINCATYLVTLIDFEEPGDLGVFIDEEQIELVESMMEGPGYLSANVLGPTFAALRANDLVWSFVVNNYLMGREPFPFDLLTWNSDSTNLPAAMQSYYLRNMYLHNRLIKPGGLSMKNVPIHLHKVRTPTFCVSTHDDHITPWRSTYAATQTYAGPVTFCLSGSGHIAGVVNPPARGKYCYWTNNSCPADPEQWLAKAEKHPGSWWPSWAEWLKGYAGEMVPARDPANNPNVIEDAPGTYVRRTMLDV